MRVSLSAFLVLLVAGGAGFAWIRAEGSGPTVEGPDSILVGAAGRRVEFELADRGAGLRSVRIAITHARGEASLLEADFPGSLLRGAEAGDRTERLEVNIDAEELGAPEGDAYLRIAARDWSWRGGFRGNETRREIPLRIDLEAPRISVRSGLTYVRRGGAGAVVYSLGEPAARDGVRVGEVFYSGFPAPDGRGRVALFAVPADAPENPPIRVVAEDAAGNRGGARWPVIVQERELPRVSVPLSRTFLETTVRELAREQRISAADDEQAFCEINTALRRANEARIRELVADSSPQRLWEGTFAQLRNSKVTSRFAERRSYTLDGKKVSEATHYGFDLASTRAASITAAGGGRVAFAGELGIYGNSVLIDHGLGLSSLYGHLSRLDVATGDRVEKGGQLGLSGATGLAGGDHLHFAILVGQTYVDPLEWWDPNWVRTHIEARLAPR